MSLISLSVPLLLIAKTAEGTSPAVSHLVSILQTALTPAFLLVACGSILNIFSGRLSRIVDRTRVLESAWSETDGEEHDRLVAELRVQEKRMTVVGFSILCGVLSAVCVALMIALLFMVGLSGQSMVSIVIGIFVVALSLLVAALMLFACEVYLATRQLHVREEYLELEKMQKPRE